MDRSPDISIVIPVHNEEGFIEGALPRLVDALETAGASYEVIIAENGSRDATADLAARFALTDPRFRVLRLPEADYGAAMRAGFLEARGSWVVNFDIDYFSGDFLAAGLRLSDEADIVLASKRAAGADDRRSVLRRTATWGFNMVLRALFGSKVTDTHGMKMVRREVVATVVPTVLSTKDLFDTELVIRAERQGYRIAEVPAVVEEQRAARSSFLKRIPRTVRGVWRIRRAIGREDRATT
jgi:glycosyltransferase involved in cell wall biosynthesis